MMSKWSELGVDLVMLIEESVVLYVDKVRFRAVCLSWYSFPPKIPNHQLKRLPWLFQALDHNNDSDASHGLLNLLDKKLYLLDLTKDERDFEFRGFYNGWAVTVEKCFRNPAIHLMNPLTGSRIKVPRIYFAHDEWSDDDEEISFNVPSIYKVVWSSSPLEDDCVMFAINADGRSLVYCKRNEHNWTSCFRFGDVVDITFYKGELLALLSGGELLVFEDSFPKPKYARIAPNPPIDGSSCYSRSLVECSDGGLMMLERDENHYYEGGRFRKTSGFRVYKHDQINLRWSRVKSIGDEIIFVGDTSRSISCTSSSISCKDFPGFKGNRIYFTEKLLEYNYGSHIGVFNLDDETIESLSFESFPMCIWPEPKWITLSLY